MTTFYAKERAKYGNLTGQVIVWPVEYTCLLYTSPSPRD